MSQWASTNAEHRPADVKEEAAECDRGDKDELSRHSDDRQSPNAGPSSSHLDGIGGTDAASAAAAAAAARSSALHALAFMSPLAAPYGLIPAPGAQGGNPSPAHSAFLPPTLQSIYGNTSKSVSNDQTKVKDR